MRFLLESNSSEVLVCWGKKLQLLQLQYQWFDSYQNHVLFSILIFFLAFSAGGVYVNGEYKFQTISILQKLLIHADDFISSQKLFQVVHCPIQHDKKLLSSPIRAPGLVIFPAYYRFRMDVLVKY